MQLPSEQFVREELYEAHSVPVTIVAHCEKVREVGVVLADGIQEAGRDVDTLLVDRLCLVHDAMKAVTLPTLVDNPDFGYTPTQEEIDAQAELKERFPSGLHETLIVAEMLEPSFPEFARSVARIGSTGNPTYFEEGIEVKVSHYADWRVQQETIVPFEQRLQYLKDTYLVKFPEKGDEWWQEAVAREKEIEREIFEGLTFEPDALAAVVERASQ